jgi:hypothetical protein
MENVRVSYHPYARGMPSRMAAAMSGHKPTLLRHDDIQSGFVDLQAEMLLLNLKKYLYA